MAIAWAPRLEALEERKVPAYLSTPVTGIPGFEATLIITGPAGNNTFSLPLAGGNFGGTFNTTPLSSVYGLNPVIPIVVGTQYYSATATNNGTVYGAPVANGGAVAWLLVNIGPTATSELKQDALQAAIWRVEFGNNFQLNGVDNSGSLPPVNAAIASTYIADLKALDGNTSPLGDVLWISPDSVTTLSSTQAEGLVALPVASMNTQTAVSTSANLAAFGQPVTFGARVTNTNSKGPTPTGAIQFQVNGVNVGNPVPLSASGTANLTETTVNVGGYRVGAVYEPTGDFQISASANNPPLVIDPAATGIILQSSASPARRGQPITLLATVLNLNAGLLAIPVGTAVFKIRTFKRPAVNLFNGHAIRNGLKLQAVGRHTINVYYTPSSPNFRPSSGTFTLKVVG
jgi:hypothetical protein